MIGINYRFSVSSSLSFTAPYRFLALQPARPPPAQAHAQAQAQLEAQAQWQTVDAVDVGALGF